jgi:hypothetical protein
MKKLYLINCLFLLICFNGIGQNLNNHWQLGNSDVNFTTNPPTVSTSGVSSQYGIASICDNNGNLLFYTDGVKIYTKTHSIMQNGNNINGFYPSDVNRNQPAIIVPNLAINGQYFVFTSLEDHTLCTGCNNDYNKYNMYIVDFNNVLYPLGIVLNQQTQLLFTNVGYFGPLTLVKNATNDGYFVIIHTQPSQGNGGSFRSYRLNNSGFDINNPISSFISNDIGYQNYSGVGEFQRSSTAIMKFTPNGLKLGELVKTIFFHSGPNTSSSTSKFFTLDFNNSTGVFSNFTLIQDSTSSTTPMGTIYDFEFSSDGSKVYFLSDKVFVKDLTNLSLAPRVLSDINNASVIPSTLNKIQRDKYHNILISSSSTINNQNKFLHKINNQNSYSNSSIVVNSISLNNNTANYLPQLIPELAPACPNTLSISANVTTGVDQKQAATDITATNTISSGAGAIYHAGSSVVLQPTFTALAGSTLRVYPAGCTNTFIGRLAQNSSTINSEDGSFDTSIKANKLKIAPNPNNGIFTISIEEMKNGTVEVADLFGFTVYKANFRDQKEIEVNMQDKPKGIYIVKVLAGDQTYTEKIIKN